MIISFPFLRIFEKFEFIIWINSRIVRNNLFKVIELWFAFSQRRDFNSVVKFVFTRKIIDGRFLDQWELTLTSPNLRKNPTTRQHLKISKLKFQTEVAFCLNIPYHEKFPIPEKKNRRDYSNSGDYVETPEIRLFLSSSK